MSRDELDRLWADPKNWNSLYRCALDPRVIVPRRRRWMGWTVNFAHPQAWLAVVLGFAIAVGPALLVVPFALRRPWLVVAAVAASVCVLIAVSHWEASRPRE